MKLFTRIYAIALLGLLGLLAALLLLTQQVQQMRQAELQGLRDGHLLRNLRTAAARQQTPHSVHNAVQHPTQGNRLHAFHFFIRKIHS